MLLYSPVLGQVPQQELVAIEGARVHTGERWIDEATVVIRGDRIAEVVPAGKIELPPQARQIDGAGLVVTPGFLDAGSTLGMTDRGAAGPTGVAFDGFDRYDSRRYVDTLRHGVTTLYLTPHNQRGTGPRGSVIRLEHHEGASFGELIDGPMALSINLDSEAPAIDRLQVIDGLRNTFRAAERHKEAIEDYEDDLAEYKRLLEERREAEEERDEEGGSEENGQAAAHAPRRQPQRRGDKSPSDHDDANEDELEKPDEPDRNPTYEILIDALEGKLPVRIRADREEDVLNAIELAEEFHLDLILEGGRGSHRLASRLADLGVPVVLDAMEQSPDEEGPADLIAAFEDVGVQWTVGSAGLGSNGSRLLASVTYAMASRTTADIDSIEVITSRAAELLGVDNRVGRLEPGGSADLVIWEGEPADPASRVQRVFIQGRTVYLADDDSELAGGRP